MLPLKGRATFVWVTFCACFVVAAVSAWSTLEQIAFLEEYVQVEGLDRIIELDQEWADRLYPVADVVWYAHLVVNMLALVAFVLWVHQINRSLVSAGIRNMTDSPGWTVAWYFVPVADLWKPLVNMRETWSAVHFLASTNRTGHWRETPVGKLVDWWWAAVVACALAWWASHLLYWRVEYSTDYLQCLQVTLIALSLDALSIVLTINFVSRLTSAHDRAKHRFLDESESSVTNLEPRE